jgi:hypothetical protein
MEHRNLIIQLLVQDMKHEQLINGLSTLGFESDFHSLELFFIIAELMGINKEQVSHNWTDTYMGFMQQVNNYPITKNGENLLPLAEACYHFLQTSTEKKKVEV